MKGWLYPEAFLPDVVIKRLLNVIFSITSDEDIKKVIQGESMLEDYQFTTLLATLQIIGQEMQEIHGGAKSQQKQHQTQLQARTAEVTLDLDKLGVRSGGARKIKLIVRESN